MEKNKILLRRIIWFILLAVFVLLTVIYSRKIFDDVSEKSLWLFLIFMTLSAVSLAFFICALLLCYREYRYNGVNISVYAGYYHHRLKINGNIYDEHNTIMSFTPIHLSCTLRDGTEIFVTVSLTNRIALKVNNRLLRPR